jgi:hypothetical protein
MKITKTKLKQIIQEELTSVLEAEDVDAKAELFKNSIGKKVNGVGYPGATIAGAPSKGPDGDWRVPIQIGEDVGDVGYYSIDNDNLTISKF